MVVIHLWVLLLVNLTFRPLLLPLLQLLIEKIDMINPIRIKLVILFAFIIPLMEKVFTELEIVLKKTDPVLDLYRLDRQILSVRMEH